ncbi:MAG: SGNH/GDSL hydrolase family protein [Bernardetiaceae bacterium]|jgi:lysophospholipase L1-like esterase|nr:SGNH/GDSL hydrolase family protein [Bernardetiaceae bacterium]
MKFIWLLVALTCWGLAACSSHKSPQNTMTIRYLALGDSYTIGEAVAEDERYPVQLAARLAQRGILVAAPQIIARTGWTTDELAAAIAQANPPTDFDLVSLLIGVNNQYRGYPLANYEREFEQLLQTAVAHAGGRATRVFVVSIPDYGVTPFAADRDPAKIGRELDQFNAANRAVADRYGVRYFDITPISRQAAQQPGLVASDGLHPSGQMYQAWAELMAPAVAVLLQP